MALSCKMLGLAAALVVAGFCLAGAMELSRTKRCAGPFDDSCANGGIADSGVDGDCFANPSACTPGKRELRRRCAVGVLDENCDNVDIPDSGVDGDCFANPSNCSPGKRALQRFFRHRGRRPQRRCVSIFDENCFNGGVLGAGDDGSYFQGSNSPGK